MADGDRLSAADLARRSASSLERIDELVRIGVLRPDERGGFAPADAQRVQVAAAYELGGIELEHLANAIRDGFLTFEFIDRIYPEASPATGRTVGHLMAELGATGELVPDLLLAMGLAQPTPEKPLTEVDESAIRSFLTAWTAGPLEGDAPVRAARIAGDAARRAAEGWTELFLEAVNLPPEASLRLSPAERETRMFEPASRVAQVLEPTLLWLLRNHLERALNRANVEAMERSLEIEGLRPSVDRAPPAIVFADISGFTLLTDEHGDELAMASAESLGAMASGIAATHGGRLVKQLGDGVMLSFGRAVPAVDASVDLLAMAAAAGLPPLHIGISAGPVIERDGDYYGRTVNLAARLSGVAGPGEIVLNAAAYEALDPGRATPLPDATLKGFLRPVPVYRLG